MGNKIEEVHSRLIAFYPIYTDRGNVTQVIYQKPASAATSHFTDLRQVESVKRGFFSLLRSRPSGPGLPAEREISPPVNAAFLFDRWQGIRTF